VIPMPQRPRQLPLDLGLAPGLSRDDLVVSAANAAAVSLIDVWPEWPANAVVLAGPPGAGKTHLAEIWREQAGAVRLERTRIGADALAAAAEGAVLVDDADAGGLDEAGLFHLFNAVRQADGHLLLVARRFPAAWGVRLPDLASRLRAAPLVEIGEPDDMLLSGVITKLFADRQVAIEPQLVQYLVKRIERSLATAIAVVDKLDRRALEEKTKITRQLAARVLDALDAGQGALDL